MRKILLALLMVATLVIAEDELIIEVRDITPATTMIENNASTIVDLAPSEVESGDSIVDTAIKVIVTPIAVVGFVATAIVVAPIWLFDKAK